MNEAREIVQDRNKLAGTAKSKTPNLASTKREHKQKQINQ